MRTTTLLLLTLTVTLAAAVACTKEQAKQIGGTVSALAVRTAAEGGGAAAFQAAGVDLASGLRCTADVDVAEGSAAVACTGATVDAEPVSLSGTVAGRPSEGDPIHGSFTGTVSDQVVFDVDCLGNGC